MYFRKDRNWNGERDIHADNGQRDDEKDQGLRESSKPVLAPRKGRAVGLIDGGYFRGHALGLPTFLALVLLATFARRCCGLNLHLGVVRQPVRADANHLLSRPQAVDYLNRSGRLDA